MRLNFGYRELKAHPDLPVPLVYLVSRVSLVTTVAPVTPVLLDNPELLAKKDRKVTKVMKDLSVPSVSPDLKVDPVTVVFLDFLDLSALLARVDFVVRL